MVLLRVILPIINAVSREWKTRRKGSVPHDVEKGSQDESDTSDKRREFLADLPQLPPDDGDVDETMDEEVEYIPKFRLTPILSGIVVPFSILLEIPGLTEHWYIRTLNNVTIETRPNPVILDIGISLSMILAIIANACLVFRFLEKRIYTMTILCIVSLTLHDMINIVAVTYFGVIHRFNDGFTYGQAFWITVCSTGVSAITNVTLFMDWIWTPDFARSGSGLTHKQRSLVIMIIILLTNIALGSLINSFMLNRTFIDSLYFTVVTIETVGFGDIVPPTPGARVWICFYIAIGVLNVAGVVKIIGDTVFEALENSYRRRLALMRLKRKELKRLRKTQTRWKTAVERRLRDSGLPVWVLQDQQRGLQMARLAAAGAGAKLLLSGLGLYNPDSGPLAGILELNVNALSQEQLESAALEAEVPLQAVFQHRAASRTSLGLRNRFTGSRHAEDILTITAMPVTVDEKEGDNIGAIRSGKSSVQGSIDLQENAGPDAAAILSISYDQVRESAEKEERMQFYSKLVVACALFLLFWLIGSAIFVATEHWSYGTSMYFCFITFSTVGYGDFHVATPAGRAIFVVWALLGIAAMTILFSIITDAYSTRYKSALTVGVFDKAIRRYRRRPGKNVRPLVNATSSEFPIKVNLNDAPIDADVAAQAPPMERTLSDSQRHATELVEALPREILRHVQTFQEHVHYVMRNANARNGGSPEHEFPESLKALMDDIAVAEKIGDKLREEIAQDQGARNMLFMLSVEKALETMMSSAQQSLSAIVERDRLLARADRAARRRLRNGGPRVPSLRIKPTMSKASAPRQDGTSCPPSPFRAGPSLLVTPPSPAAGPSSGRLRSSPSLRVTTPTSLRMGPPSPLAMPPSPLRMRVD